MKRKPYHLMWNGWPFQRRGWGVVKVDSPPGKDAIIGLGLSFSEAY